MFKKVISLILTFCICVTLVSAMAISVNAGDEVIPPMPSKRQVFFNFDDIDEGVFPNIFGSDFGPTIQTRPSTGEAWNPCQIGWGLWGNGLKLFYNFSVVTDPSKVCEGEKAAKWTFKKDVSNVTTGRSYNDIYLRSYFNDPSITNWTGATEIMYWVDASEITVPWETWVMFFEGNNDLDSMEETGRPIHERWNLAGQYNDQTKQWEDVSTVYILDENFDWISVLRTQIPAGYVGWIRAPFTSFVTEYYATDDGIMDLSKVCDFAFGAEFIPLGQKGNSIYYDSFSIVGDNITLSDFKDGYDYSNMIIPGDVNLDGDITTVDALFTLQAAVGKRELDEDQITAADIDGNGKITAYDALIILQISIMLSEYE
jgi:hypothetical protein